MWGQLRSISVERWTDRRREPRPRAGGRRLAPSLLLSLGLLLAALPAEPQRSGFKVIVNARVSTSSITAKEVSRIFLKKITNWPSGLKITPVNLGVDHPSREAFSLAIHGKGAHPIQRRWETLIFSGMGVPPQQIETEAEVIAFIGSNAGAIGYVSARAVLPPEVKELEIKP